MICLDYNINVFCEKPLTNDINQINKIYNLVEKNNLKLFIGFNRRYDPIIQKLYKNYRNGKINKVKQILVVSRDYSKDNNLKKSNEKLDFHYDSIIDDIDTLNWILGETPINIYSHSDTNNQNVTTILNYKSFITATIISSREGNYYDQRIEFMSDEKTLIANNKDYVNYCYTQRYQKSYKNELIDFYSDIINNRICKITKNDIINNYLICEKCIQSIQEKKNLKLNLPKFFRNYETANNTVIKTYLEQRQYHNLEFNNKLHNKYCVFNNKNTFWELFDILKDFVDLSDPDINLPNQHHLFQTAEAIRLDGLPEWFQFIGLIHDLGKIIFKKGCDEDGTSLKKQFSIVGDTFILGCPIPDTIVYSEFNIFNSYHYNKRKYNYYKLSEKEKLGIYNKNCGLNNVKCSFGHDEYLYQLLKYNNVNNLPQQAYYIIRFHSLYLWHYDNEYIFFENENDKKMKFWVQLFQKYDLYTKVNIEKNEYQLKEYYTKLINNYLPKIIKW